MRKDWPVKKHLRNCVSAFGPAPRTQSSHRGHCPSNVSPDLANSLPEGPLRRTWSRCQPKIEAGAHVKNDPATPKARLSDRTTQYSTRQFSTGAVIFDPAESRCTLDSICGELRQGRSRSLTEFLAHTTTLKGWPLLLSDYLSIYTPSDLQHRLEVRAISTNKRAS